ncbi:MAG: Ppx/GppA family phosphatase [Alphaproteobacteria bacterium]|nr:Ppx/GppA family phosphatase [Alphaproteobacteria bacterium]
MARKGGAGERRVGVIDVGSNSVRLVVFDGLHRAAATMFNEKVLCGLGRGLGERGRLDPAGAASALATIGRFAVLAKAMRVARLEAVGTAALRDAGDGKTFAARVRAETGVRLKVISGEEEGRLSALGVVSGIPAAAGVMGDLGGGSLELVTLMGGEPWRQTTLPLGPLRLAGAGDAKQTVDRALSEVGWLRGALEGRTLYAVGGAWRALARLHMGQMRYPLHVIHHYQAPADAMAALTSVVGGLSRESLGGIEGLSSRRIDTMRPAALVLRRLIKAGRPRNVVFSAHGLREGLLHDLLPAAERKRDPLLAAARRQSRDGGAFGDALLAWTDRMFADQDAATRRLRHAACLFSDIAWQEHPEYRPMHAFERVLRAPIVGIDHPGRAFLAAAVHARYLGRVDATVADQLRKLVPVETIAGAGALGAALRLGHTLAAGSPALLGRTKLKLKDGGVRLKFGAGAARLDSEVIARRVAALDRAWREAAAVG